MAVNKEDIVKKATALAASGKFKKALSLYIKIDDQAGAGLMYERLGQDEAAIECYTRSGHFLRAAELSVGLGNSERSARMFVRAGVPRRAAQAFLEAGKHLEAARMFERAGDVEDAAQLYEQTGRFSHAASLYESCGKRERAVQLYIDNGRTELAARLCAQSGEYARAAQLYAQMEIFLEAARCYVQADMQAEAIDAYDKADAFSEAAKLCEEAGAMERAAHYYEKLGDTERAVELFTKAGDFSEAGRIYEDKRLFYLAARQYAKDRRTLSRAADLYKDCLSIDLMWEYDTQAAIWDIALAEKAGRIVLGLSSADVVVLDKQGALLWKYRIPMGVRCRSVAVTPDAARLAIGTEGRSIYMLDASSRLLWKREVGGEVRAIAFADNSQMLVAACTDGHVRAFQIDSRDLWSFQTEFKVWHLAVNEAKRQIIAGTGDGQIYVFDFEGQVVWKERADDWVGRLAPSANTQHIAAILGQKRIRLYDVDDRRMIWDHEHELVVQDAAFWNDRYLVVCTNGEFMVWDLDRRVVCREPSPDRVMRTRCSADGQTVYIGYFERGLRVVQLHDCVMRAAHCYEECEDFAAAAELFEQKGEFTSAAKMHALAGNYAMAAEIVGKLDDHEQAGAYFEQAGEYKRAAECYEKAHLLERAAACYDRAGNKSKAGALLAGIGKTVRAAELQLESGDFVSAGRLFQEAGALEEALDAYEKAAEAKKLTPEAAVGLGRLYLTKNRLDDVIRLLQPYRSDSAQRKNVAKLLAECLMNKKEFNIAVDHYKEALTGEEENHADNTDTLYGLGSAYEKASRYEEAKDTFKKILLVDYYFKDVAERIERIDEMSMVFGGQQGDGQNLSTKALNRRPSSHMATMVQSKPKRYEVIRKLGEGGMGVVYEARDTKLDRIVAMKVLPSKFNSYDELKSRFLREARAVASLSHENVVAVYDIGEEWGESYIAMEFVDGHSLRDLLEKKKKFTNDETIAYARQIADGLSAAHRAGIVHRDIKPENVMITKATQQVKLMDFGLARMDTATNLTQEGAVMGTWRYMPPEQIRGGKVSPASDVYSTGVMLYEMLAGQPPFCDGDLSYHHINTMPTNLIEVEPGVPAWLSETISRCLAKNPIERFADGGELRAALTSSLTQTGL